MERWLGLGGRLALVGAVRGCLRWWVPTGLVALVGASRGGWRWRGWPEGGLGWLGLGSAGSGRLLGVRLPGG